MDRPVSGWLGDVATNRRLVLEKILLQSFVFLVALLKTLYMFAFYVVYDWAARQMTDWFPFFKTPYVLACPRLWLGGSSEDRLTLFISIFPRTV